MKRVKAFLLIIAIALSVSCGYLAPVEIEEVNTPLAPTLTPDLCSAENLADEMEIIRSGFAEFQEITFIANSARAEDLIEPILQLEEVRTEILDLSLPGCLRDLQSSFSEYSASVIRYLTTRMEDPRSDDYLVEQKNSETLWQAVEDEYEKAVLTVQMEFIPITGSGSAFDIEVTSFVLAINDGTQSVNIRASDDLDSVVVGRLEPGMQALVVGKNEPVDWLRINMPGIYGWVFSETVELKGDLDEIPVISHN